MLARQHANNTSTAHEVLRSFYGVHLSDDGSLEYRQGHEQIPENWYHAPVDYGLVQLNLDTLSMIAQHPELGSIGGNVGTVNSFTGVDLDDIAGGVLNAGKLLESNNLVCFALQVVRMASPSYLNNLYATLDKPLKLITKIVSAPLLSLDCPVWDDLTMEGKPLWTVLEEKFPGAKRSQSAL